MTDPGTSQARYVERRMLTTTRALILTVALAVQFGLNGHVLVTAGDHHPVELAAYAALALTGAVCAATLFFRSDTPAFVLWPGVLVLLACSVAMSVTGELDPVARTDHWSLGLIGWYGLVLLCDRPLPAVAAFFGTHALVSAWPVLVTGSVADVSAMAVVMISVFGLQIGVALGSRLLRTIADSAVRTFRAEEELRIQEEAATATARDQERRYARLRETTLPLLAGLADGSLDPHDPVVRRRCAIDAAKMRTLFTEHETAADPLVHELNAIVDVAGRHDVSVQLFVQGAPGELPDGVRRALLTPVAEALVAAGTALASPARVTVLRRPDGVRVSVRCAAPDPPMTWSGNGCAELTASVSGGQLWLETSWRSP